MRCFRSVHKIRNLGDNMSKVDNEKKPQANRKIKNIYILYSRQHSAMS